MPGSTSQHPIFKGLKSAGLFFVVLLVGFLIFKDLIIQNVGGAVGSSVLGAPMRIGHFSWSLIGSKIVIKDLTIGQPPGFGQGRFIEIPQMIVTYDAASLLTGRPHMPLVALDLREITVIKDTQGHLNVDALKVLHPQTQQKAPVPAFAIDELKLNIGKVVFKDSFKKPVPQILVYDINIKNKTLKNIDTVAKLVAGVLVQALKPTAIQSAGVYAAATLLGVGFLPGAVFGIVVANDAAAADVGVGEDRAFAKALEFIKTRGRVTKSDKDKGLIEGKVQGVDLKIKVEKTGWLKSHMTVGARKFMLPKKEFAAGILYQIVEELK